MATKKTPAKKTAPPVSAKENYYVEILPRAETQEGNSVMFVGSTYSKIPADHNRIPVTKKVATDLLAKLEASSKLFVPLVPARDYKTPSSPLFRAGMVIMTLIIGMTIGGLIW